MKKAFLAVLFVLMVLGLCSVGFAERTKVMKSDELGVSVIVPATAPEFLWWDGDVVGQRDLGAGQKVLVVHATNSDKTVFVGSLWFKDKAGKLHIVGMQCSYARSGKTDIIEDLGFRKNGVPTGILSPVDEPISRKTLDKLFPSGIAI